MTQLPPKAPNWPNLSHQRTPSMGPFLPPAGNHPSWVDEFLDFSTARRGSHRRSASDSVAFLEAPVTTEFERLDDDQLMYMFSDDVPPNAASAPVSSSNTSSPSDHNSINEEKIVPEPQAPNEAEVQSECKVELQTGPAAGSAQVVATNANGPDTIVDPKRVKRFAYIKIFSVLSNSSRTCPA